MLFFNWKLVEIIYFFPEEHFSGKAICDFIYSNFSSTIFIEAARSPRFSNMEKWS